MKLTVLVDNNTLIDRYFLGEPGVSFYIEDGGTKLLLDAGYSDIYVKNAEAMGIDLTALDMIVISHGHDDHTKGLLYFPETEKKIKLTGHPRIFECKSTKRGYIGMPFGEAGAERRFELCLSAEPVKISPNITFLGEIPRIFPYENREPVGMLEKDGVTEPDFVWDDSALAYETGDGIYIITGCSHSGICNICEYAKKVTGRERILGIIGGLHLRSLSEQTEKTAEYFRRENIHAMYPCHCTCFAARAHMNERMPVEEVGVGLTLEW